MKPFHGSYQAYQVQFLLKPISINMIDVAEKEWLIQSGQKHYSEMLSPESLPTPVYWQLFTQACTQYLPHMANDCLTLAALIVRQRRAPVLVSLARAGTPIGVALQAILSQHYQQTIPHYSVSIIRDRGIDTNALRYILRQGFAPEQLVFIDGWTGKGVIARELQQSIVHFNQQEGTHIHHDLFVLSDLAGVTPYAASCEDYLIPSSILNACVSGLVSRSMVNEQIGVDDFHGCVFYEHWREHDVSQWFIEQLLQYIPNAPLPCAIPLPTTERKALNQRFIATIQQEYQLHDINLIKPGIGESTRVLLRREPQQLLLQQENHPAVQHLRHLALEKNVPMTIRPNLPYLATALIRKRRHD